MKLAIKPGQTHEIQAGVGLLKGFGKGSMVLAD